MGSGGDERAGAIRQGLADVCAGGEEFKVALFERVETRLDAAIVQVLASTVSHAAFG